MPDLTVDLDTLAHTAHAVTTAVDRLRDQPLDDLDCAPTTIGHAGLAHTLRDFRDSWHDGIRHLVDDGTELAIGLTDAHAYYVRAEHVAADAVRAAATALTGARAEGQEVS